MNPIAIFQHDVYNHPELFLEYMEIAEIPCVIIESGQGGAIPLHPDAYAGLVFMGGVASANDTDSWISDSLRLIRQAVVSNIPVIGHCLGGQMLAKATGGTVECASHREVGWFALEAQGEKANEWFGRDSFHAMQWHGEAFSLPPGAELLLSGQFCQNQAFLLNSIHIGMQFHIEIRLPRLLNWMEGAAEANQAYADMPHVHDLSRVMQDAEQYLGTAHTTALTLYKRWLANCRF